MEDEPYTTLLAVSTNFSRDGLGMEPWSWLTEGVFFTKWPVCFGNKCVENTWACYKNYDMFLELRNANYISSEIMKYEFRFVCFSSLGIYHM